MSAQPVDVRAALDAAEVVVAARLAEKRRDIDRALIKGNAPHPELAVKADRAEYIRDELREARAAVAELIEASRELKAAMDEPERGPFDTLTVKAFHEADARFSAALARIGGGA